MPTYEYECQKCGDSFERFQNMTDKPLQRCPKCRGKVKRLIGVGAGIIFKGSGFYETDYRKQNYKESAKREENQAKPDDGKKKDTKTSSTPEAKSEVKSKPGAKSKPEAK